MGPMGYSLCLAEHLEDLCVVGTGAAGTRAINPGISGLGRGGSQCCMDTEEGVSLAKNGFPQWVRKLALELHLEK